tara:strand:+ start:69 stop:248 length:180 start_codon:yes stop_codon:yes gene_type:complete
MSKESYEDATAPQNFASTARPNAAVNSLCSSQADPAVTVTVFGLIDSALFYGVKAVKQD